MSQLTIGALLAVLAAACAWLAMHSSRKCAAALRELTAAVSTIRSERSRIEVHDLEIERTADALRSLRGKFYAERSKSALGSSNSDSREEVTDASTVDVATLKAQLRRKAGLVAGRPAPHRE